MEARGAGTEEPAWEDLKGQQEHHKLRKELPPQQATLSLNCYLPACTTIPNKNLWAVETAIISFKGPW